MACVTSVNFAVLVNGSPTGFFPGQRGLRQGCPLSPLLFLLVIDGLSRAITLARDRGEIGGVRVSTNHQMTHLLFVDDVVIFGTHSCSDWEKLKEIFTTFSLASYQLFQSRQRT